MPASPADSAIYRDLFADAETAQVLTDSAEIRAMLLVWGALARVQAEQGLIPAEAAAFIDRVAREVQIDPAGLAAETARNGVPVPALIAAFRKAAEAPEMMRWLHWGATSQDIMDTALALRLRRVLGVWEARLEGLLAALGALAEAHADLAMAGRTYGQAATPTSFGAVVASWGRPLLRHQSRLQAVKPDLLQVSLSGAAGTLSAMGPAGPAVRAGLAKALNLVDPGASWHSERDGMVALAGWMAGLAASLGKMAEDMLAMTQSGISELRIAGAGGSSTMPQKQNPVGPAVLVALSRQIIALAGVMTGAGLHRQQRDGAAWFTEWLTLPQLLQSCGRALALAQDLAGRVQPDAAAMGRGLRVDGSTILAEALSFDLAGRMPRPEAEARVKALCQAALAQGQDLLRLAAEDLRPAGDISPVEAVAEAARQRYLTQLGQAPAEARAFAKAVSGQ